MTFLLVRSKQFLEFICVISVAFTDIDLCAPMCRDPPLVETGKSRKSRKWL